MFSSKSTALAQSCAKRLLAGCKKPQWPTASSSKVLLPKTFTATTSPDFQLALATRFLSVSACKQYEHIDWTKSQELVFESLKAGQRDYFFNVKLETATNRLYVKLREKTHRTGRSSSVFLGLSDLDQFTESCTMALDVSPKPDPYTQFKSRMFEGKEFSFSLRQNQMGKYLEIRENYVDGSRPGGATSFIFVADRDGNQETIQAFVDVLLRIKDQAIAHGSKGQTAQPRDQMA